MKKYLLPCFPVSPHFFIILSLLIVSSNIVFAQVNRDTAYYFSERGKLLWCDAHAAEPASFVIRTKRSFRQVFDDIPQDDPTMQISDSYSTATVNNIQRRTARKVKRLLKHGAINDPLVLKNIVPVLPKRTMQHMYNNIVTLCMMGDAHKYKEHGGVVFPDGTVTCISGELSDPRRLKGAALVIKEKALVYYHSHPDGYAEQQPVNDRLRSHNHNRVEFSQTSQVQMINYVQGPSRQDQASVGEGTGYVFGMKAGGGLIYIYDSAGVKATLPISFVKKMRKRAGKKVHKIDTSFAGLFPILPPLPHLF